MDGSDQTHTQANKKKEARIVDAVRRREPP